VVSRVSVGLVAVTSTPLADAAERPAGGNMNKKVVIEDAIIETTMTSTAVSASERRFSGCVGRLESKEV
jgi:hypothetical protein